MRAIVYCRVSTHEQASENHYSIPNQKKRARDYIKARGWTLLGIYDDELSGKNDKRHGYKKLQQDVEQRRCDVVIVYRLDRLSRNVKDIYDFIDLVREKRVEFVSITENFDTTNAMGRAMLGVAAVFAQLTREIIGENVRDGVARRAEAGKWNGNKGNPPTGYLYSTETGSLLPDPATADTVRQVFRWYTEEKLGTRSIARRLNVNHVPKGLRSDAAWHETVISKILANPIYCGQIKVAKGTVKGQHEPLISDELFQQAHELIQARRQLPPRTVSSISLLSGIPRCANCGTRLIMQTRLQKLASGEVKERPAYRHTGNV